MFGTGGTRRPSDIFSLPLKTMPNHAKENIKVRIKVTCTYVNVPVAVYGREIYCY
jgi:hypothetical protein